MGFEPFKALGLAAATVAGIGASVFVGTAIVQATRSNGEVDYCYVEMTAPPMMAPQYQLFGHRPWREDRPMGVYPTLEDVKAKADLISCRMTGDQR